MNDKLHILRIIIHEYVHTALGGQTLVANGPIAGDREDDLVLSQDVEPKSECKPLVRVPKFVSSCIEQSETLKLWWNKKTR